MQKVRYEKGDWQWISRCECVAVFHRLFILLGLLLCVNVEYVRASVPPYATLDKKIKEGKIPVPYQFAKPEEAKQRGINAGIIYPHHQQPHQRKHVSSRMSFNALAILIQFSDKLATGTLVYFDSLLFGNGAGTLRGYYQEISYGQMDIVTINLPSSLGWSTVPQTYEYYVDGQNGFGTYPHNAQKMVEDAVRAVDSIVDYSRYDNDGDGFVDALFIVHAGPGAEFTGNPNDIWSHQWTTLSPVILDGVNIYAYSTEPEYWVSSGDMTCGVYAHEMGHAVFGLPDLYDYGNDSRGIGRWSLMASGSWNGYLGNSPAHPDAWSCIQMGFLSPSIITDDRIDFPMSPVEESGLILKYIPPESDGSEYFLLENRQKKGFDKQLRGEGLLIYHIDGSQLDNNNQWYPGSDAGQHYKVALEQADGRWDLERNQNAGDASDPFPGTSVISDFNAATLPGSTCYFQTTSLLKLENIRENADVIRTTIFVRPPSPRIALDCSALEVSLVANDSTDQIITVRNNGSAMLDFQIVCDSLPVWMSLSPESGHLSPDAHEAISIHLTTSGIQPGIYETSLHFNTNDSLHNPLDVPLSLRVTEIPLPPRLTFRWDAGWSLISNPAGNQDTSITRIFSSAMSDAYGYRNDVGYTMSTELKAGRGYWMKFDSVKNVGVSEYLNDSLTIDIAPGWNLIGTIASPLPVQQVVTVPPGNLGSYFFKFHDGYCRVDTLFPGQGYWVNMKEQGQLVLKLGQGNNVASRLSNAHTEPQNAGVLAFRDARNKAQKLFLRTSDDNRDSAWSDLPPLPPQDIFDIRFVSSGNKAGGTQMQYIHSGDQQKIEFPISLSSVSYPLTLTWTGDAVGKNNYTLVEVVDGVRGTTYDLHESKTIVLNNTRIISLLLCVGPGTSIPDEYYLEQNYPNPFNPSTIIRFGLPADAVVTLTVYNEIGQEITALLKGVVLQRGEHEVEFVPGDISAGVYFYRLVAEEAREQSNVQQKNKYIHTQKMILLK
jgi:immune inhibitor A